jgi:DNA-binding transcriptional MerR regulator
MVENEILKNSLSKIPKYRIGAVSRLTGLSSDVVRVWERRYSAIKPLRSDGGSRLYSDEDIARLRKLRQAVEMGHAIGQVARLADAELDQLSLKSKELNSVEDGLDPYNATRDRFLAAIAQMDVFRADEEIHRAATLYPPRTIVKQIISPLLEEIGSRWAHQEFGIAQEHVATNLIRNLLSSLFRLYPPDKTADSVVLATPTGEQHEFGILIGGLLAATHGWQVIYLGTDLPPIEIAHAVKLTHARVLILSLITYNERAEENLRALAEHLPSNIRVWLGGEDVDTHRELIEKLNWTILKDFHDLDDRLEH